MLGRHLKETISSSNITWSEMGKQNIQAKEVYCHAIYRRTLLFVCNRPFRKILKYSLFVPPNFAQALFSFFCWDHCKSQEKLETMLIQNLGGQTKSIMVFSEVAYSPYLFLSRKDDSDVRDIDFHSVLVHSVFSC